MPGGPHNHRPIDKLSDLELRIAVVALPILALALCVYMGSMPFASVKFFLAFVVVIFLLLLTYEMQNESKKRRKK